MINKTNLWSMAHINNNVIQANLEYSKASFDSDIGWLKYLISETPNGYILKNNVLYDIASNERKIYLAHITRNINSLLETKKILASSGCLIGSIYCTPVIKEGKKLRLHNLGKYIFKKEAPIFSQNKKGIDLIIIELEILPQVANTPIGINYLKLGPVHFSIF